MKVGIVGYGFVGKALREGLNDDVEILKIDPKLNTSIKDLKKFSPDVIFVCLPTPMLEDGNQDISIVTDTIMEIKKLNISALVVLKSTIHPGNMSSIKNMYPKVVYNPEFLREKHAKEDFINSELIIFGGDEKASSALAKIYSSFTKCINKDYIFTDAITASMIKYTINSFLATKVIFFNEINSIFQSVDAQESWEDFTKILSRDTRIGDSHMMVPGHDGRFGFGGACLPKDINALVKFAENINLELNLLKTVIKTNNKIRASYNSNTHREDEQNINYNNLKE